MSNLAHFVQRFELGFPEITESEYRKLMLFSVSGIFLILLVLLAALVMAASNIRPWEDEACCSR